MNRPRYIVFDDTPKSMSLTLTADQFAEALRAPLAGIGVSVVRRRKARADSQQFGLCAKGLKRSLYFAKTQAVEQIVNKLMIDGTVFHTGGGT